MSERYERNMKTLTPEENERLRQYHVLVAGCGGLGGYIVEELGRIGIGHITVVDSDVFEESNLNRQLFSSVSLLGTEKVEAAKARMAEVNPDVSVNALRTVITEQNAENLLRGHDLVMDALDSVSSRRVLEAACETLEIPLIHGAIAGWFGQVSTIFPGDRTLEKLYPGEVNKGVETEWGNPSFTPALVASIQVAEAIKVLLKREGILRNKLLCIDLLSQEYEVFSLAPGEGKKEDGQKDLSLAILGFGNAGKAFAKLLLEHDREIRQKFGRGVRVTAISTKSRGCLIDTEGIDLSKALSDLDMKGSFDREDNAFCEMDSLKVAEEADYDVLVELTPLEIFTGQPATDHIRTALSRKKHAITANKGPIAWAYRSLRDLAEQQGVCFYYETTVMDGTPVFNLVEDTLPLCKVLRVKGILNSTTNFVLEELAKGKAIEEVMEEGRARGFVEADPSMDMLGWDAAAKTAALLNVLMDAGITPNDIDRKGIDEITPEQIAEAASRGNVIKLLCLGELVNGNVKGKVGPEEVKQNDLLATITGTSSVVSITTDLMGTLSIVEHEPEIEQTGYGVFGDLLRILKNIS